MNYQFITNNLKQTIMLYLVELTNKVANFFKFTFCNDNNTLYSVFISEDDFASYLDMQDVDFDEVYRNEPNLLEEHAQCVFDASQKEHTNYDVEYRKQYITSYKFITKGGYTHTFSKENVCNSFGTPENFTQKNNYKTFSPVWG